MPAAVLVLLTLLAYVPAMQGGFVWDDDDYVTANRTLRTVDGLGRIWAEPGAVPQYYPLTFTSLWLEYRLWGLSPTGYHVTNVLLHAVGAVLLFAVLRILAVPGAWLAAAIFAVHPVHVESVAWITERKNVLSGVFYLGAALAYLRSADTNGAAPWWRPGYWVALGLFVCALLSKTVACTLPAALLLVRWWKRGRIAPGDVAALVPFFAIGAGLGYVTIWMETHHVGARGAAWALSFVDRCLIAGRALWFYAVKLIWPAQLTFIYPRWRIDASAWWQYLFPAAALALVVALFSLRARIGRGPLAAVLFFAVTLAPALGFVDVYPMRYSFVADHFQYHASIGLIVLAVAAAASRLGSRVTSVGAVVVVVLTVLTWRQGAAYADLRTLWTDTLAKNPACSMARINLGMLLYRDGKPEQAIAQYTEALRLEPDDPEVHVDLAMALAGAGRSTEAMAEYAEALRLDPDQPKAHNNVGNTLAADGRLDEAVTHYRAAIRADPHYADAHGNLANVLAMERDVDAAIAEYRAALAIDPDYAEAHQNLGIVLAEHGRQAEAVPHYRAALRLRPDAPDALGNLAWLLATSEDLSVRRPAEAIALAERACQLTGYRDPGLLDALAAAHAAAGHVDVAVATARKGVDLANAAGKLDIAREIAMHVGMYEAARSSAPAPSAP